MNLTDHISSDRLRSFLLSADVRVVRRHLFCFPFNFPLVTVVCAYVLLEKKKAWGLFSDVIHWSKTLLGRFSRFEPTGYFSISTEEGESDI